VRVTNNGEGINIYQLNDAARSAVNGYLTDLHNPHSLGLDANEAFFLFDQIVLVEGQEDVLFLPKALDFLGIQLEGDLFGWGVGGAGKMHLMATILDSLGFDRVVGIVDADKSADVAALNTRFARYFFTAQPADDVRKKDSAPTKTALLSDDYTSVRPEFEAGARTMFTQVNTYLTTGTRPEGA
jgi:hypothetical protein